MIGLGLDDFDAQLSIDTSTILSLLLLGFKFLNGSFQWLRFLAFYAEYIFHRKKKWKQKQPQAMSLLPTIFQPFPTYSKYAADNFKNVSLKIWKISKFVGIITEKKLKTLWRKEKLLVLSTFCHNSFKSRLLQMRLQVGKS